MKTFTKSVLTAIALMASVTTANAQYNNPEEWEELASEMWHQWSNPGDETHCTKDAEIVADATPVWNLGQDIGAGSCILGAENVTYNLYADISGYDKLILFGAGGPGCRVMCNRVINEGAWKNMVVGFNEEDSHWDAELEALVIDLNEFKTMAVTANGDGDDEGFKTDDERVDEFVHLHCLKNAWGGEFPVNVSAAYLWKDGGSADGIKTVENKTTDGKIYNLQGQEVKNASKGIFIQNGKKYIVK